MAASAPGSRSARRRRAPEPPTSRELESTKGQQPFLRSTPGGIGPRLRFKPRTAPSLLACSWHSLASHWRRLVPPRMHFQGDPAKTFGRGRGQAVTWSDAAPAPSGSAVATWRGKWCLHRPPEEVRLLTTVVGLRPLEKRWWGRWFAVRGGYGFSPACS